MLRKVVLIGGSSITAVSAAAASAAAASAAAALVANGCSNESTVDNKALRTTSLSDASAAFEI